MPDEEPATHLMIDGRKWRASDPNIPPKLRQELVDELMAARRAVKAKDPNGRHRVQDAKVALGERGAPWWEPTTPQQRATRMAAAMRSLLRHRSGRTICPSDVARVVGGPGERWRSVMQEVRDVAATLSDDGEVVVTERGTKVDPRHVAGPIRIRFSDIPALDASSTTGAQVT